MPAVQHATQKSFSSFTNRSDQGMILAMKKNIWRAYRQKFGVDLKASLGEVRSRMDEGIARGWLPDAKAVYGAVRWYHREEAGANPKLAELYRPIIGRYFE